MKIVISLLLAVVTFSATADELNYNVVNISASASEELANDLLEVTLSSYHQDEKSERAASQVNRDMAWAIALLKKDNKVKYQTRSYNTHPNYDRNSQINSWTASQRIVLKSGDFERVSNLLSKLQSRLKLESMRFTAKDETRAGVQDELTVKALEAFKRKAEIIRKAMAAKSYRVVEISVNQQGQRNPPVMYARAEKAMLMDAAPAVAMEAGESKITSQAHGAIQLVY